MTNRRRKRSPRRAGKQNSKRLKLEVCGFRCWLSPAIANIIQAAASLLDQTHSTTDNALHVKLPPVQKLLIDGPASRSFPPSESFAQTRLDLNLTSSEPPSSTATVTVNLPRPHPQLQQPLPQVPSNPLICLEILLLGTLVELSNIEEPARNRVKAILEGAMVHVRELKRITDSDGNPA